MRKWNTVQERASSFIARRNTPSSLLLIGGRCRQTSCHVGQSAGMQPGVPTACQVAPLAVQVASLVVESAPGR